MSISLRVTLLPTENPLFKPLACTGAIVPKLLFSGAWRRIDLIAEYEIFTLFGAPRVSFRRRAPGRAWRFRHDRR